MGIGTLRRYYPTAADPSTAAAVRDELSERARHSTIVMPPDAQVEVIHPEAAREHDDITTDATSAPSSPSPHPDAGAEPRAPIEVGDDSEGAHGGADEDVGDQTSDHGAPAEPSDASAPRRRRRRP